MAEESRDLIKLLHVLPVSASALRLLIGLIAEGALGQDRAISNLALGRACFASGPIKRKDAALKNAVRAAERELAEKGLLQVSTVKVGKGHGAKRYRVYLDADAPGERREIEQRPRKAPPIKRPPSSSPSVADLLRRPRRTLPPALRPNDEQSAANQIEMSSADVKDAAGERPDRNTAIKSSSDGGNA